MRQHHAIAVESIRLPEGYSRAFLRREQALGSLGGDYADGETRLYYINFAGRAIVGIGMASVRETNLSLLRPWGVPFIPGSALKGLASHVAHDLGGDWKRPTKPGEKAGELQRAIFGDITSAGAVVFHDAWWKPSGDRAPIHTDAMTVHHAKYYQGEGAPADWDEPNPVGFLTVNGTYLAAITGPADALEVVDELVRKGLAERGVGAKTAAGYGRATFERHLSDITRQLNAFTRSIAAANTVQQHAQALLVLARQARSAGEKRIAAEIATRMVKDSPAVWKKWLENQARTDEERALFRIEQPEPAVVATMPQERVNPTPVQLERRQVRAWYIQDKKVPARFSLRIEGEPKDIKGHLIPLTPEELERLKTSGPEGATIELEYEDGRPKPRAAK